MSLIKPFLKPKDAASYRVHMEDPACISKISYHLSSRFEEIPFFNEKNLIVVCIGSDRSTGDSLGPLVGTCLKKAGQDRIKVMGSLDSPVHATNLDEHLNVLKTIDNTLVIAVDACLGNLDSVGFVSIGRGALKPGAGVNKTLPPVGHLHITGIVNVGGFMEYFVLQNTRLHIVMRMAEIISEGLLQSVKSIYQTS